MPARRFATLTTLATHVSPHSLRSFHRTRNARFIAPGLTPHLFTMPSAAHLSDSILMRGSQPRPKFCRFYRLFLNSSAFSVMLVFGFIPASTVCKQPSRFTLLPEYGNYRISARFTLHPNCFEIPRYCDIANLTERRESLYVYYSGWGCKCQYVSTKIYKKFINDGNGYNQIALSVI
jgi:hypothetical protein